MSKSAVEFENVTKVYRSGFWGRRHKALTDLNLIVPAGSVFGFLGANGAGKTTAIKTLLGIHFATSGNVRVWGESIDKLSTKARIGYLPERPNFHGELTGNEFLNFHRSLFGQVTRDKPGMANQDLLQLVGIPDSGNHLLREYSKGMLQRIGIAQALVNSPDLVVLDEPMSGLDPVGRRDVRHLIDRLSNEGKTIFFSTHILSDVETLCDQIAFLEKGILKANGSVEEILAAHNTYQKEIIFDDISETTVHSNPPLKKAQRFGRAWKINAGSPEEVRAVIEAVWQNKGKVNSMTSPQMSLEAALFPSAKN